MRAGDIGAPGPATPQPSGSSPTRVAGLDGIRTVAVTVVLLVHADLLPGGFIGVDLFFVLSGFLITSLMLGEVTKTGHLDLIGFWSRRAFRLVPAVSAYLLGGILVGLVLKPDVLYQVSVNAVAVLLGVFNYVFDALGGNTAWDGHLWSLSVEAQFYVFWPLLLVLGLRYATTRRLLQIGVAAIAVLGVWRAVVGLGFIPGHTDWYHSTDTRVDGFVAGAVLALALHIGAAHAHAGMRRVWAIGAPSPGWGWPPLAGSRPASRTTRGGPTPVASLSSPSRPRSSSEPPSSCPSTRSAGSSPPAPWPTSAASPTPSTCGIFR